MNVKTHQVDEDRAFHSVANATLAKEGGEGERAPHQWRQITNSVILSLSLLVESKVQHLLAELST